MWTNAPKALTIARVLASTLSGRSVVWTEIPSAVVWDSVTTPRLVNVKVRPNNFHLRVARYLEIWHQ